MKSMLKDAAILFVITFLSGALLGLVYEVTKEPIAKQQEWAQKEACKNVFADAENFEEISMKPDWDPESLTAYANEQGFAVSIDRISTALSADGSRLGYVMTVTSHEGYGGDIQFTMGVRADGSLNGISILSIAETAGLGMRAEEVLKPQFAGRMAEAFEVTKTGAAADNQIDAISGATITSHAFVNGVNAGLAVFKEYLVLTTEGGELDE